MSIVTVTRPTLPSIASYLKYMRTIWRTNWLTNDGELVQSLTGKLQRFLKVKNLLLVANGTQAIELAVRLLGQKGEVITTPFTFSATTNALVWTGLTPIFADIDPETYNLDPGAVEEKITPKTIAILPVHVYGNPCNVEALAKIAKRHNLPLIYDAAHAFGVEYKNQPILNYGDLNTLSFHATKVFHTIEGGAITTQKPSQLETLKLMRNHGIQSEEEVPIPGTNAKMNEFEAAMGLCNLPHINKQIQQRKQLYQQYKTGLNQIPNLKFQKINATRYNYSYMPVQFKTQRERDLVYKKLGERGVRARKYFYPLTVDFGYFGGGVVGGLGVARGVSGRVLCLPLYPGLGVRRVDWIVGLVGEICKRRV